MNLEQIPTLVLTPSHDRLKNPIEESRFRVSLDSGPKFKPTHVRREAEDPISLTLLIDGAKPKSELLAGLDQALADLVPRQTPNAPVASNRDGSLRQHDHISVYTLTCGGLVRSADDLAAVNALALKQAVDLGLNKMREKPDRAACPSEPGLWDTMAFLTRKLVQLPGRRVLAVVTDGTDRHSKTAWKALMRAAQIDGVTVIGLMRNGDLAAGPPGNENAFDAICESSGGVELGASGKTLPRTMHWLVQMLRERYIIEFPRGDNFEAGEHLIEVSILKSDEYIRTTGITVPVADKKVLDDPTTLHGDPGSAPPIGTRRPLGPG